MNKALRYFSFFVSFSVLLLILKGALVTSHDAGLSVPDWPTSYGDNMFLFPPSKWTGTIFYEHVHRLLASFVGAMTLILTIWILIAEKRKWVKVLSVFALVAVILQGILGGVTVLYQLPAAVSSAHAVLAQTFFIITIILAYSQSAECERRSQSSAAPDTSAQFSLCLSFLIAIFMQLVIGAFMRHTYAGIAVPDFPTMGGSYFPSFDESFLSNINQQRKALHMAPVDYLQIAVHLLHRLFAVLVFLAFLPFAGSVYKDLKQEEFWLKRARTLTAFLGFLILLQITLGIITLISVREPWVASFHVMFGALLLGMTALTAIRLYKPRLN